MAREGFWSDGVPFGPVAILGYHSNNSRRVRSINFSTESIVRLCWGCGLMAFMRKPSNVYAGVQKMNVEIKEIIGKLVEIKHDIDAIYHHQSDRIVQDLDEVIESLRQADPVRLKVC